jgi:hypothetical protein
MRLLEALADAFIRTFGITEPTGRMRRRASWFIVGMLALVLFAGCAGAFLLVHLMHN